MPNSTAERILECVRGLREGTTICPGRLARDLGFRLADLRATYVELANAGHLCISQRGRPVDPNTLKGPFRLGPS